MGFFSKPYVDDEYQDLRTSNPLLHFCVILRELETYHEEQDYLTWCRSQLLEPGNSQVREHYMKIGKIYREIESIIGTIDSHINNFDFELNAGAAQALRSGL